MDIPVILNSVNIEDNYDGDFTERRFVTYTINFTVKSNFYGPVTSAGLITNVIVNIPNTPITKYNATGNFTTKQIEQSWNDASF